MFNVIFFFFLLFGISAALYAVFVKSVVKAVFSMFAAFFSVSAVLIFTQAEFLAIAHLMIYIGGIIVVMVFAMMLSSKNIMEDTIELERIPSSNKYSIWLSGLLCISLFVIMAFLILNYNTPSPTNATKQNTIQEFGVKLLSNYAFQLEIISLVLLVALMAASIITRKESKNV